MKLLTPAIATLLMFGLSFAHAEPQTFLCLWKAGPALEGGDTLYADNPLVFGVDLPRQKFQVFNDLDKTVLGQPTVLLTERAFKLEFQNLTITGLEGRSKIVIWVDRFDLDSTMSLETWLGNVAMPGFSPRWTRSGNCKKRQF
jgi:hypothetical protein